MKLGTPPKSAAAVREIGPGQVLDAAGRDRLGEDRFHAERDDDLRNVALGIEPELTQRLEPVAVDLERGDARELRREPFDERRQYVAHRPALFELLKRLEEAIERHA